MDRLVAQNVIAFILLLVIRYTSCFLTYELLLCRKAHNGDVCVLGVCDAEQAGLLTLVASS